MVSRPLGSGVVALGFKQFALNISDNSLEAGGVTQFSTVLVLPLHLHVEVVSEQHGLLNFLGQFAPGSRELELEFGGESGHHASHVRVDLALRCRPRQQNTIGNRVVGVADN